MDITNVMVEFIIESTDISPEFITNLLNIKPSYIRRKGEVNRTGKERFVNTWCINTEYQESLDINIQIDQIFNQIKDKSDEIKMLYKKNNTDIIFSIVIKMYDGFTPTSTLTNDFIGFAYEIGAIIQFDLYSN